jgi:hypothetical protein
MATPSLSPSFVIGILAKREAIKAVKADLQARGVRLSYASPRDIRIVADQYLAQHRAEIVAQVMETVRKAPELRTLYEKEQRELRKIHQCQTQHQQQ